MRRLACLTLVAALAAPLAAAAQQRGAFDAAYRLYENGDCAGALAALGNARPTPRTESLRGLCLYADGELVEARLAFTRYLRMVPAAYQNGAAHQSILAVIAELDEALRAADRTHAQDLQRKRMQRAEALAAQTKQRLEQQRQRLAAEGSRQLLALHASARGDFDGAMRGALDRKSLEQVQRLVKGAADKQATAAAGSLKDLFARFQGRSLAAHPFPLAVTAGMTSYTPGAVTLDGNTIAYRVTMSDRQGRRLEENGTIQGFDLARVTRYTTRDEGELTAHVFEFDAPRIWRRGGARYADGTPFDGEITSSRGESTLRVLLPAVDTGFARASFTALIDAARAARAAR